MKNCYIITLILIIVIASNTLFAASVDEYVQKARTYQISGELDKALGVIENGLKEFPNNSTLYAYTGLYTGMKAGQTGNLMEAGQLSSQSFNILDKAVSLDPENPLPLLFRGLMSVNVPEFLGKLDGGIKDLQKTCGIIKRNPDRLSKGNKILAWKLLATAYSKTGDSERAAAALEEIVKIAPGSDEAKSAESKIKELKGKNKHKSEKPEPETASGKTSLDSGKLTTAGREAFQSGDYQKARDFFEKAVKENPKNAAAYKWLGTTIAKLGESGYDDRIAENTDLRTALVFDAMNNFDRAVELAPDDLELRFIRGSMGVYFPFFAQKLEQSIKILISFLTAKFPIRLKLNPSTCWD